MKLSERGFRLAPQTVLLLFCSVNVLVYFDRGLLSAAIDELEKTLGLSNTLSGVLASAFLGGYMISSPIFAHFSAKYNPLRLMSLGLVIWCAATAGSGLSVDFWTLLIARTLTGAGEAAFVSLAAPAIDAAAPPDRKSIWLAMFYTCLPVGFALGFGVGGAVIGQSVFGEQWSWRALFLIESMIMVLLVFVCLSAHPDTIKLSDKQKTSTATSSSSSAINAGGASTSADSLTADLEVDGARPLLDPASSPYNDKSDAHGGDDNDSGELDVADEVGRFKRELLALLTNKIYMAIAFGYAAQTFMVGGFAYWGVTYAQKQLHFSETQAGSVFGGVSVVAGLVGTAAGGAVLDKMRGRFVNNQPRSLEVAIKLCYYLTIAAMPVVLLAFVFPSDMRALIMFLILIGETLLFMTISPINSAILWGVPDQLRPMAMALSVVFTHALGDAISPVVMGRMLDSTNDNWNLVMFCTSLWLIWTVISWGWGYRLAAKVAQRHDLAATSGFDDIDDDVAPFRDDGGYVAPRELAGMPHASYSSSQESSDLLRGDGLDD
eukprot:TRINITY_DN67105_c1_g16_i1.p1 TRINITY_DN67105_c1_g16~~TRINITY_DN67105_c1_g16_i1.p1  ORF type:complete len:548 (-),score=243.37 TRINITY_DN67105_c1_g16_i1:267-1910(-)